MMELANQFKLPVVDFSSYHQCEDNPSEEQIQTAKELDEANRKHGFVCLRNSGLSRTALEAAFQSAKALFDLDDDVKLDSLKQLDPLSNTGYSGFGKEALNRNRLPDLKEVFNIRNTSVDNGDLVGTPPAFEENSKLLWDELKILGYRFSLCCALALGIERDYFSKTLSTMDLCTMRMLHYPPCPEEEGTCNSIGRVSESIRVGEHTDFGAFTFLFVNEFHNESSRGLQVKAVEGSDLGSKSTTKRGQDFYIKGWNNVAFDQETLDAINEDETCAIIVNTGALMARWTNDIWRATAHRVIIPSAQAQLSHRYSIAMFFDPDKEEICSVHPKLLKESGTEAKYPPIKSIDYLIMKLKEAQGVDD